MSASVEARLKLILLALLVVLQAGACAGACVEVDSDTEAVANRGFKLGCISCKRRGEVKATAAVTWLFKALNDDNFSHLYSYEDEHGSILDERFESRVQWRGNRRTLDLQDGSIYIANVTFNDTGTYMCVFSRVLVYDDYTFHTNTSKIINVRVVPTAVASGGDDLLLQEDLSRRRGGLEGERLGKVLAQGRILTSTFSVTVASTTQQDARVTLRSTHFMQIYNKQHFVCACVCCVCVCVRACQRLRACLQIAYCSNKEHRSFLECGASKINKLINK
ncbi:sodium channel, voltage-gated, type I, beta a isoform X1 [Phycodurus eques]|uniref:sodium channel, voltage-gated, type I, beta a isoform X1 n=1 Tax=Phycodurus eques TaxID=693459 RepID=UPI002ACD32A7|nr:sodium channel, voltage-gated, type I, beta a isoform X1 [Phycodurus eques]